MSASIQMSAADTRPGVIAWDHARGTTVGLRFGSANERVMLTFHSADEIIAFSNAISRALTDAAHRMATPGAGRS